MEGFWKHAVKETLLAAAGALIFLLFAVALFAVIVHAYAPGDLTVTVVGLILKAVAVFFFPLLFVRRERAFFKGAAAGAIALLLAALVFGLIGGFHFGVIFPVELLLGTGLGGLGAVCGVKLRKE